MYSEDLTEVNLGFSVRCSPWPAVHSWEATVTPGVMTTIRNGQKRTRTMEWARERTRENPSIDTELDFEVDRLFGLKHVPLQVHVLHVDLVIRF